jgi:hypothetical protein
MKLLGRLILASIAATSCAHSERNPAGAARCADAVVARDSAVALLKREGHAEDFFTDQGRTIDDGESWDILIPKREYELPGDALIVVRKADCKPTRIPLK